MSEIMPHDPVAIVAIGCRFPGGAGTPREFWELLCRGMDAITEIPGQRFDLADVYDADPGAPGKLYTRWGGFVEDVDGFDAGFFGISPREAARVDPQQRMLLEVVWEALEDGGLPPDRLAGSNTGVFVGISTHDYYDLQVNAANRHLLDPHSSTGTATSIAANRISYIYDLRGPSMAVDTACSSSLTAVHLACHSLRSRECDLAIVAGVNAFLTPEVAIGFCKASMLSPDGRCRAFDAGANGFVRAEGAGAVVLKPLARALEAGDRIYAIVRGSAINQDGRTVGITVPSPDAQEALIRDALRAAGLQPGDIHYVEAHGTGTRVGDPIEASAIGRALANGHARSQRLILGSVKTNIGHLEAAAGIAGLIKAALSLRHRAIPPSLHFTEPNPAIPLDEMGMTIATTLQPWPADGTCARAGVNSFGFGGANAHVVLEEPPATPVNPARPSSACILPLSARHPGALRRLALSYRDILSADEPPSLGDLCYSAAVRRSHHAHRVGLVADSSEDLIEQIDAFGSQNRHQASAGAARGKTPGLVFVFTGMGPQWWAMGRQLLVDEPVFREAIEECDGCFRAIGTWPLLESLTAEEGRSRVHEADQAVAANLVVQVGLVRLLESWGIVPDAIVGHSAGEVAAAWAAGALSLEDALRVAFHRGRLQHRATGSGTMLSVGLTEHEALDVIQPFADRVAIAAVNSPTSVALSGPRDALQQIAAELSARQRFNRFVRVAVAYHASPMDALRDELLQSLRPLTPGVPSIPLVSTVTGTWVDAPLDPEYWFGNLRRPVRFADAIARLSDATYDLFLEVGPHPALSASVTECLAARGRTGVVLPTLRRTEAERRGLLRSVAALYTRGRSVNWSGIYPTGTLVPLPVYPWQRERLWFEPPPGTQRSAGIDSGHSLLGCRLPSMRPEWETRLADAALDYLIDHQVQGRPVFPAAAYVEIMLAAARDLAPESSVVVEDLAFKKVLFLTNRSGLLLRSLFEPRNSTFEIHSGTGDGTWALHAGGTLRARPSESPTPSFDLAAIRSECRTSVAVAEIYESLAQRGLMYQGLFRGVRALWCGSGAALAEVGFAEKYEGARPYRVHPALLDSAFQALLAALRSAGSDQGMSQSLYLPVSIRRIVWRGDPGAHFFAYARITRADSQLLQGDITIAAADGRVAMVLEGFQCKALDDAARARRGALDELTYRLGWEQKPLQTAHSSNRISGVAEIVKQIQPQAERLAAERGWTAATGGLDPALNEIATHFARAALLSLGWSGQEPAAAAVSLHDRLRIPPRHHRLFARLLEIVQDSGPTDAGDAASERAAAERLCARVLSTAPETGAQIDLLRQCGQRLAAILRGEVDAREVLFGPTAAAAWARFFAELPWYQFYNRILADAVAAAVDQMPASARIRVLEIGAGTGGTTISVLPRLDGRNVQYHFTDVSQFFLAQARERFREREFVRVGPLDIEADPVAQVGAEPFDVIIAANVLHATHSLATTLDHVRRLLAPGGLLVLLESTQKKAWADVIFGITEGWWRFADLDVRPDHPLMSADRWQAALTRAGFEAAAAVSERCDDGNPLQAVLLATRPARDVVAAAAKNWLVFADGSGVGERIAASLRERGHRSALARAASGFASRGKDAFEIEPADVDQAAHLLNELAAGGFRLDGVIHTWSADAPPSRSLTGATAIDASCTICGSVLALVQALARNASSVPPLWLVTTGAQAVVDGSAGPNVAQAPLWGIGRVLTSEQPHTRCRLIDLSAQPRAEEIEGLLAEIESDDPDEEIAFRETRRYVTRLRRIKLAEVAAARSEEMSPDHRSFRVEVGTPGALESLSLREIPSRPLGPGELLIRVHAAGVNFRDVMLSLGMLPPMSDARSEGRTILGFECAGIVVACGEQVCEFSPGDEVMAVALGAFGSLVVTRAEMVARKPGHLTFEQAATVPLVFVTALYALNRLGRLSPGERVLIHAATGGVGLAAIQLARRAGAVIFATAGNPEKRQHLKALGIEHVMDSRSLAFADEVMAVTGGEGVDVVLNSLAGEAITKGLSILRPYGRFLELGKRDIHADSAIGLLPFDRNLAFCSIALERMCVDRPADVGSMLREIAELIERRELQPIPHTAFDIAQAHSALRYLAQARHIGKLVLTLGETSYPAVPTVQRAICRPEATYVISGGLGGFGLLAAQWLVDRGATHLVLVSRTGAPTPANAQAFERLRASSASVVVMKGDISRRTDVARMVDEVRRTMPPVRGVMHAAMVLDDAPLARMSVERLQAAIAPKVGGAWNLHEATMADPLDFFVMFSSVTSVFGSKGQGNYAAANLFLDTLAPYRRSTGRPALTINWGALSGVGHVSQHGDIAQHLSRHGLDSFTPAEALQTLEEALTADVSALMMARVDWARWSSLDPSANAVKKTCRLAHLGGGTTAAQEAAGDSGARRSGLAKAPAAERSSLLQHGISELVASVLGTSIKKVDAELPLTDMGIDSLMAVELQTLIEREFGAAPPLASLLEGATIRQLSAGVLTRLVFDDSFPPALPLDTASEAASNDEAGPVRDTSVPGVPRPQPATRPESLSHPPETSLDADVDLAALSEHGRATSSPGRARPSSEAAGPPGHAIDYSAIDYARWSPLQRLSQQIVAALFRLFAPVEVIGRENIPMTGPIIIAVNHLSMLDVALLLSILPRRGVCIATDRLRKHVWLRWFLNIGDTIYVRRGEADRDALEQGLAVLRAGGLLGVAPEGTRSRTGGLMSAHQGVAYLAIEAPARIVPVAAYGQELVVRNLMRLRRTRVHVRIGSPISIPRSDRTAVALRHGTERVMIALGEMLPAAYRGVYADKVEESRWQTIVNK